jgi:hypothetical protein
MFLGLLGLFVLFSLVVMLLWNLVMPGLLGMGSLDYPRAAGLLLLCRILFGGLGPGFRGMGLRGHFHALSPEQREAFARRMHERFFGPEGHKGFGQGPGWGYSRRAGERPEGDSAESSRRGE